MYSSFLLTLLLHFAFSTPTLGQYYTTSAAAAAATSSLTPAEMSASSISSVFASLATATPQQQSGEGGGPGDASSTGGTGNAAGASGSDTTSFSLSKGGLIAIIVVVVVVAVFGMLFYLAKKRSWEVRATIRRSAKRVATALTPRRSEFPSSVKQGRRSSKNMSRINEVPPTPKIKGFDLEKGNVKTKAFEMKEPSKPSSKWGRKADR